MGKNKRLTCKGPDPFALSLTTARIQSVLQKGGA